MKKRILGIANIALIIILILSLASGCTAKKNDISTSDSKDVPSIDNYRDIPGITESEIKAIEGFKSEGRRFSYACLFTSEMYLQSDGTRAGFTLKFAEMLSDLFEIPFDVSIVEWEDLISGLNSTDYDFTGELTATPERELQYKMTLPIVERGLLAFSLADSPRLETEDDINGKTIGFLADTITAQSILEFYPTLSFKVVEVSDTQDAMAKLKDGTIDAFIDESISAAVFSGAEYDRSKELFSMVYTPISLTTANPDLEPIVSVVDKFIVSGGINKIHDLYISEGKKYNKNAFSTTLTDEEAAYIQDLIQSGSTVPVALEHELYPISFYNNQTNEYQGIAPEVLHDVSVLSGIEFEAVTDENTSWSEIIKMLESGEIALVSELLLIEERKGKFLFSENPYATCRYALLSKMDFPNLETYQVSYAKIGAVANTAPTAVFENYFPRHPNVTYYQYHSEADQALENGEVDLLVASEYQLLSFVNYHEKPGYKINRYMNMPIYESYFGFNLDETVLNSIFNKAMKYVDSSFIEKSWVSRSFDYEKALTAERERLATERLNAIGGLAIIILIAFIVLLIFIIRDFRKRKIFDNQTAIINAIYHSFPDNLFTKDLEARYTSANKSALLFAETDLNGFIGKTALELFPNDEVMTEDFADTDGRVLKEHQVTRDEVWHQYSNGTRRLYESIKTPLISKGETIGILGYMRDITEHRELFEKVKYQAQYELVRYSLTSRAMNIVHFDMDIFPNVPIDANCVVTWSDELKNMLGFYISDDFPNVLGAVSDRIHPDDKERVLETFASHIYDLSGETICDFESRIMINDGSYKFFRIAIGTLRDEEGVPIRIAGAMEDITEKKRIQQSLDEANRANEEARSTLESIMNGFDGMLYVTVPGTGELLFINDYMKEHFELGDDCIGQYCYEVFQENQYKRCDFCPCNILDENPEETIVWEEKNSITNRSYRNSDKYILWPDGRTVHIQYSVDMTELFEAKEYAEEQRLFVVEEHKRLQEILDMLPIGVRIMQTGDGTLLYANEAAVKIFRGESFDTQAFGQPSGTFLPEYQPDGRKSIDVYNEHIINATPIIEIQCTRIDGELFTARFTTCRINYQGELCSLGIVEDVTAEKEYQQKLLDIAVKEQEANLAKSEFLAKMSHEIRTPMNAIIGMSELALRERMSSAAYEQIFTVKQSGAHLLALINEILDFSKIETGKMEIVNLEYSFSSLANDVISVIRMRLFDKQIRFAVNIDSKIPDSLIGDVTRIRQVLINIMGNAVKYTDQGFLRLNVNSHFVDDETVMLSMDVEDSGRGIKKEDLENLFGEYMQVDIENNQDVEGVGLGLAISWNLVNAMGGKILVDSEYGVGSTFTVELPQKINKPAKIASVDNAQQKNVIVCERRKLFLDSIEKTLEDLEVPHMGVTSASKLCEELSNNSYRFILISQTLFDKDRDTILKAAGNSRVVLLAEFGEVIPEGNWSVLVMPAHSITIANILNGMDGDYSYSVKDESVSQFLAPEARILVVDDINTNLKVAEGMIKPYGITIDLCKSGEDAIKAVKNNKYDIVFMDHRMPGMDGIEATKRIKELSGNDARFNSVPIIALTANAVSGMREMFLANGFDDYLSKPIETNKLNSILEKWLDPTLKISRTNTVQKDENEQIDNLDIEGIDMEKGLLHVGGEMQLYLETLSVFCEDADEKVIVAHECLDAGDYKTYTIHLHAMKSAAANVGAGAISEAAKELEMAGARGDVAYINTHNEDFFKDLGELVDKIKKSVLSEKVIEDVDSDSFIGNLTNLKTAIESMDPRQIKSLLDDIRKASPAEYSDEVMIIARSILLSDFDEAIESIDKILQEYDNK